MMSKTAMAAAASVVLCWFASTGCSVQSDNQKPSTPASSPAQSQQSDVVANAADPVEEGYSHPRIDARRKAIYPYFERLKESRNAEEERKAVEAMAAWAKDPQDGEDGYVFRVETTTTEHVWLSKRDLNDMAAKGQPVTLRIECPCFPPVTPWMEYRFKDPSNLKHLFGVLWEPAPKE
ncbi:MAG: hypothetical protein H8E44_46255 [Planctomycetes bacterium]|nr:hypothetical protein [Planctomycetota bacterium]